MKLTLRLVALLVVATALAGCGGDQGSGDRNDGDGEGGTATAPPTRDAPSAPAVEPAGTNRFGEAPAQTPAVDTPKAPALDTVEATPADGAGTPPADDAGASSGRERTDGIPAPQSKADEAMVEFLEHFGELRTAFESITDEESAKAAGEKIREIVGRMQTEAEAWNQLAKSELAATSARYQSAKDRIQIGLAMATMPVMSNRSYTAYVKDAMKGLPTFPSGR